MELDRNQKIINAILTFIQYAGFALFLYFTPWIAKGVPLKIIELLGFILAFWAIISMKNSKINIAPKPLKNSLLIKSGPYAIIRHPMYTSIIIVTIPLIISSWDIYSLLFLVFLYINLILKLLFEESLLKIHFNNYENYMKKTWRVIPCIF